MPRSHECSFIKHTPHRLKEEQNPQGILSLKAICHLKRNRRRWAQCEAQVAVPYPTFPMAAVSKSGKANCCKAWMSLTLLLLRDIRLLLLSSLLQIFCLWKISGENKFSLLEDHVHFWEEMVKDLHTLWTGDPVCSEDGKKWCIWNVQPQKKTPNKRGRNWIRTLWFISKTRSKARKSLGDLGTPMLNLGLTLFSGTSMHDQSNNQVYSLQLPSGARDKYRDAAAFDDFVSGIVRLTPKSSLTPFRLEFSFKVKL